MATTLQTTEITRRDRSQRDCSWREYRAKPRIYFHVDGESVLENFAYRTSRPYELYRQVLPHALRELGLAPDVKCIWSQKAGCSCGCSPGFIVQYDYNWDEKPWDAWVTVAATAVAQRTDDGVAEADHRARQLMADPTIAGALQATRETLACQTGRSAGGNLRNFRAMGYHKLNAVLAHVVVEDNDPEAISAIRAELLRRS